MDINKLDINYLMHDVQIFNYYSSESKMLSLPSAVRVLYKHLLSPAVITEHICKVVEKGGFWYILKTTLTFKAFHEI